MGGRNASILKAGLEVLYLTNAHRMMRPLVGGVGAILMLHHVRPAKSQDFAPNALLEVTPEYLESVIKRVRATGFDIVSMDEACRRLVSDEQCRPFVTFTFDDGYRDNLEFGYPILKHHDVPFTIYLPTAFMDGHGEFWWLTLEHLIQSRTKITASIRGEMAEIDCSTPDLKKKAFDQIYWWMRALPGHELYRYIADITNDHQIDYKDLNKRFCADLCMSWDELRVLAQDPLVTFGAHTVSHLMLAKFDTDQVRSEMDESRKRIALELNREVDHLCYPVGDPSSAGPREFELAANLGFKTGVTTRPGVLFPEHREHLTALPRVSLNGNFQSLRYLDVLLSGAPFALLNKFRRVNAA